MKKSHIILIPLLSLLMSCTGGDALEGFWSVKSDYYKATCHIIKTGDGYQGLAISYNDGTTIFEHDPASPKHFFKRLKLQDQQNVDGVSGATEKSSTRTNTTIKVLHQDSIKITTYIMNRPVEELWTKISGNE